MSEGSAEQAAAIFGVTPSTLHRWCEKRQVPFRVLPSGRRVFNLDNLRRIRDAGFVEARTDGHSVAHENKMIGHGR